LVHRLQGLALVRHVALGDLDQVRDQVVSARQLHVDLREGVLEGVAGRDEAVVDADCPQRDRDGEAKQGQESRSSIAPLFRPPREARG
jgi:hypothetical protein